MKGIIKHIRQIREFPFFYVHMDRKKPDIAQSKNTICVTLCPTGKHSTQISLSKVKSPPDHIQKPARLEEKSQMHTAVLKYHLHG